MLCCVVSYLLCALGWGVQDELRCGIALRATDDFSTRGEFCHVAQLAKQRKEAQVLQCRVMPDQLLQTERVREMERQ